VFVCILPGKAIPKMTYTVSGGTLNPTHSLTPEPALHCFVYRQYNTYQAHYEQQDHGAQSALILDVPCPNNHHQTYSHYTK